jgi:hypothetical protein
MKEKKRERRKETAVNLEHDAEFEYATVCGAPESPTSVR